MAPSVPKTEKEGGCFNRRAQLTRGLGEQAALGLARGMSASIFQRPRGALPTGATVGTSKEGTCPAPAVPGGVTRGRDGLEVWTVSPWSSAICQ